MRRMTYDAVTETRPRY